MSIEVILQLVVIFLVGSGVGTFFQKIKIPKILGYILAGIIIGKSGLGIVGDEIFNHMKIFTSVALAIIIFKAGMGLEKTALKKIGVSASLAGFVPCLLEGIVLIIFGVYIFNMPVLEAGLLGFIIAAVSPAIIVPLMLKFQSKGLGNDKGVSTFALTAASVDDVISISIFYMFANLFMNQGNANIGIEIAWVLFGTVAGIGLGILIGKGIEIFLNKFSDIFNEKWMATGVYIIIMCMFVTMKAFFPEIRILELFTIIIIGYIFGNNVHPQVVDKVKKVNDFAWSIAGVFLFTLVGAMVEFSSISNIPGFSSVGAIGMSFAFITVGLVARYIGVYISAFGTHYNSKERLFLAISNTPKATVQAALASLPLTMGALHGELILGISVFSILFTAPLGIFLMAFLGPKLLTQDKIKPKSINSKEKLEEFFNAVEYKRSLRVAQKNVLQQTGKRIRLTGFWNSGNKDVAAGLTTAVGAVENIKKIHSCSTRLYITIKDATKVNKPLLINLGAKDAYWKDEKTLVVVFGLRSNSLEYEMHRWTKI